MAAITKHLEQLHPAVTSRELSLVSRDGRSLRDYHSWLHDEYEESTPHSHDEHGQLLFHDRRDNGS